MAIKKLPVDSSKIKYEVKVSLNGTVFITYYRYNTRAKKWVFRISDEDENIIFSGIFINPNTGLSKWIKREELISVNLLVLKVE